MQIVRDISPASWIRFPHDKPILKESVFEGFSVHPQKLSRSFSQPQLQMRLRRLLKIHADVFERVLKLWENEKLSLLAFLEMLDPAFLLENWNNLKDFFGGMPQFRQHELT